MEGSKAAFPTLLCNGNLLSSGDVPGDGDRHFAEWDDPFPKPSYLFGLVAGPLVSLSGASPAARSTVFVYVLLW
jgi:aminopeptidase N